MKTLKERAKESFIKNQKKIENEKTSKEERKFLIKMNKINLSLINNEVSDTITFKEYMEELKERGL